MQNFRTREEGWWQTSTILILWLPYHKPFFMFSGKITVFLDYFLQHQGNSWLFVYPALGIMGGNKKICQPPSSRICMVHTFKDTFKCLWMQLGLEALKSTSRPNCTYTILVLGLDLFFTHKILTCKFDLFSSWVHTRGTSQERFERQNEAGIHGSHTSWRYETK